jgi:vacuolar-type H+-ATPase subunit E/Vma4
MTKIMKIKYNTKRKKYIKRKKNDKTIKRRKYYLKKIRGGGQMTVNQRQNLITNYQLELDKLLNKVKSSLTTIATEKDFYNMIESRQDEVNDIVNKYICPLLMNDIAPDAPNEKVVQEINKYLDESIVELSKLRSKIPNLPPAFRLVQPKDIIPLFTNKYLSRMDIVFKYIKGYILSIDDSLDALLFIFRTIFSSPITDEMKSKLYHIIFKMYEEKIKNYSDEVYTTNSSEKQRVHKMVTLMMNLATLESNFDLIKFIVFNNVDIQDYLINKHKSIKDFILSYGNIRYIKMTRKIPIYNYWNSLVEKRTGMNIFDFKRKLLDYVKSNDICRVLYYNYHFIIDYEVQLICKKTLNIKNDIIPS